MIEDGLPEWTSEKFVRSVFRLPNFFGRGSATSLKSTRPALGKKGELVTAAQRVSPVLNPLNRRKVGQGS